MSNFKQNAKPCVQKINDCLSRQPGGGGYSWEFLVGVCRPVLQILTRFQTKKCNFPDPFSDHTSKIQTRFQTWPLGGNYVIITQIRGQTNIVIKSISKFLSPSYSFGIETIDTSIHSRSSPENHTRFQTEVGKVYTCFETKTAQNPNPMGRHLYSLYKGVPPPPPGQIPSHAVTAPALSFKYRGVCKDARERITSAQMSSGP